VFETVTIAWAPPFPPAPASPTPPVPVMLPMPLPFDEQPPRPTPSTATIARPATIETRASERAPLAPLINEPSSVDPLRRRMIAVAARAPNK
jgi:hypothetical protein